MKARIVYGREVEYFIEGKKVTKKQFDRAVRRKPLDKPPAAPSLTGWPRTSLSCGVDPEQIDEAEAHNRRMGDGVTYVRDGEDAGDAIFTSRLQRRQHKKNIRLSPKNGGFFD